MTGSLRGSFGGVKQVSRQNRDRPFFCSAPSATPPSGIFFATTRRRRKTRILVGFPHGAAKPHDKKTKNLHNRSCGFSAIRIDHGHRRGGHDPISARAISSVGRAPRLHRGCRRFDPFIAHHFSSDIPFFQRHKLREASFNGRGALWMAATRVAGRFAPGPSGPKYKANPLGRVRPQAEGSLGQVRHSRGERRDADGQCSTHFGASSSLVRMR